MTSIREWTKYNLWKTAFKNFDRPYPFIFFTGCLPQIVLGPFLNTLNAHFIDDSAIERGNSNRRGSLLNNILKYVNFII